MILIDLCFSEALCSLLATFDHSDFIAYCCRFNWVSLGEFFCLKFNDKLIFKAWQSILGGIVSLVYVIVNVVQFDEYGMKDQIEKSNQMYPEACSS